MLRTISSHSDRTVWFLCFGSAQGVQLGPIQRVIQMGRLARDQGHRVVLAFEKSGDGEIEGMELRHFDKALLGRIIPGDPIIVSSMIHPALLKALLDSGLGFDADLYGLGALEHIETEHVGLGARKIYQSRRRMRLRFRFLAQHSERIYLSNRQQLAFLGGMIFSESDFSNCRLASGLPAKTLFLPMGIAERPLRDPSDPFPPQFEGRPVFLWGGGIWSWFDTDTLLQAFRILADRNSPAALYFLCGTNPSGLDTQDGPVERTWAKARELGLLGATVAFHDGPVAEADLPAYLNHCAAAIMSNPERLESVGSWRTRLLDAPPFGMPVVVCGYDPLSAAMVDGGAGLSCRAGDAAAFAEIIDKVCSDAELLSSMQLASRELAERLSWNRIFQPWLERLEKLDTFKPAKHTTSWMDLSLFFLGI